MKYLILILVSVLLIGGCSHKQMKKDIQNLKSHTRDLAIYSDSKRRKIVWLVNQNEIRKIRTTYPADIELIKPVLKKFWTDNQKIYVPLILNAKEYDIFLNKIFLIPVPMYENDINGRLYMIFDPNSLHEAGLFIQVNKQKVTFKPYDLLALPAFFKQWKEPEPNMGFRDDYFFKGNTLLQRLHKY